MRIFWNTFSAVFVLLIIACNRNPDNAPDSFELHPEFRMELTVSEPLVFDPVEMHFDETGGMFVLEMPGYPLADAPSRLVQLLDTDGDGAPDTRSVFDSRLGVASSFLPYKRGFLVASPPELIWIADTDGDGIADTREVIVEGFSNDNLQHNFNGLAYGLDNWIYIANGGNSGSPFLKGKPETRIPLRGGDVKIKHTLNSLERVGESSGGYKLTFDNWGHLFETHNLEHNLHLVFEDRYIENVPGNPSHGLMNISDHEENGLARVYPIGEQETRVNHPEQSGFFSGSCGITYYGGGKFPEEFQNGLFVADVVLNLVHFDKLKPKGSTFVTSRYGEKREFLASTDRAFRPVNFTVGPDGSLYVLDMHRGVIEHPEWIPDEIERDLDLNGGKEQGRIYRIWPKNHFAQRDWDFGNSEGLLRALGHPNQWVRITAQRIIVTESVHRVLEDLQTLIASENPFQRLHALWTLDGLGRLNDDVLLKALADGSAGIRESALRIAESRMQGNPELTNAALALTLDSDSRVRLQAFLALTGSGVAFYPDHQKSISDLASSTLNSDEMDRWMRKAITAVLLPQAGLFLQNSLAHENPSEHWNTLLADLMESVGRSGAPADLTDLLDKLSASRSNMLKTQGLFAIATGWSKMGRNSKDITSENRVNLINLLNRIEQEEDRGVLLAASRFRKEFGISQSERLGALLATAQAAALDTLKATDERLEWLQLSGISPFEERIETLGSLLDSRVPNTLQREALKQIWDSGSPGVPELLFEFWGQLGPESRRLATDILLYKEQYHESLIAAMETGKVNLGEFNLDLERRRALLFSENESIRQRAEKLFSDAGVVNRADVISAFKPALLLQGAEPKGKALFVGRCASCHKIGEIGVEVGPSLADIGRKSKETLMNDILDPNAAVDAEYLAHTIIDGNGTFYTGVVARETDEEVALLQIGGEERTFRKDQIRRFSSSGLSLMPEGLEQGLTPQDFSNLLAFLQAAH